MNPRILWAIVVAAPLSFAASPYYSDTFTSINPTNWVLNGGVSGSATGLMVSAADGGSVISRVSGSGGTVAYENRTMLKIQSCSGRFVHYIRATPDSRLGPSSSGTFVAAEFTLYANGSGGCNFAVRWFERISGILTQLGSFQTSTRPEIEVRTVMRTDDCYSIYIDGLRWIDYRPTTIATGWPGVGIYGPVNGNRVQWVEFRPPDFTAPTAPGAIASTVWPNSVDLQWQGSMDDPNGSGLWQYHIWRDGVFKGGQHHNAAWSDPTVNPSTTYTYQVKAIDWHGNESATTSLSVTTPPAGSVDQRSPGVRPLGSYWGAAGENIDMQSGNLNFSLPLLAVKGRGSTAVGIALSYNSQNWRRDPAGDWKLGKDVGYGFGWRLMAGSVTPHYSDWWTIHHYVFTDSSGAEYRLDQNSGGVWTSREGIYVSYDQNTNKLWFNDGTFWLMGAVSDGGEEDAGARYPTLIQDSNGNQMVLRYGAGRGAPATNSSARLSEIDDPRGNGTPGYTYSFAYTTDPVPHLISINNNIGTAETHTFSYQGLPDLKSPFASPHSFGSTTLLDTVSSGGGETPYIHDFGYSTNDSGELTKVTLPFGGDLEWVFGDFAFASGKTFREVTSRILRASGGGTAHTYALLNDPSDAARESHIWRVLLDASQESVKVWWFETDPAKAWFGLSTGYEERNHPHTETPLLLNHTWLTNATGNPYIAATFTVLDSGKAHEKVALQTQILDGYGNLISSYMYDYGNTTSPARTYTYTYLTDSNYTSRYIRNRVLSASLTAGGTTKVLFSNNYDTTARTNITDMRLHDAAYTTTFQYRGNVTSADPWGDTSLRRSHLYDIAGNLLDSSGAGPSYSQTMDSNRGYMVPQSVTPGTSSLTSTMSWNTYLGLTQLNSPNSVSQAFTYDSYARPATKQSPYGAVTTYSYALSPPTVTATTNGRWTKTTNDGLGRAIKVEQGHGSTTVSITETEYGTCACSPTGKVKRVSMPYAPGATVHWTMYAYDARGRTLSVTPPGNAGSTAYVYEGNTVKVTDPAGKWKKYEMDAHGNLVKVWEPNPAGGADLETLYTYNAFDQLTQVSMTRGAVTQTRAWVYDDKQRLVSVTLPENDTTTYGYDSLSRLAWKQDAKGQKLEYSYDGLNRVTQERSVVGGTTSTRRTYVYDTAVNGQGRLHKVIHYHGYQEEFGYESAGLVTVKTVRWSASYGGDGVTAVYAYDNEGRRVATTYPTWYPGSSIYRTPVAGRTLSYGYDAMGRPYSLTDVTTPGSPQTMVASVSYNAAGRVTESTGDYWNETRQYNARGHLTRQTGMGVDIEYRFSPTANDGRLWQRKDWVSGEEVTYQYDQLGRLAAAETTGPEWGLSFGHDGFGNLTQQTVTKGTAPSMSMTVDQNTNRLLGTGISYDANGNMGLSNSALQSISYNVENRVATVTAVNSSYESHRYSARNERLVVLRQGQFDEVYFYDINETLLEVYRVERGVWTNGVEQLAWSYPVRVPGKERVYFHGRLLAMATEAGGIEAVVTDRLGSVVKRGSQTYRYYPYGQEIGGATANDKPKFGTYTRDAISGLDYAMNRHYYSIWGRFTSPDPYLASGGVTDPGSWNRYAYVQGDPVNLADPTGLMADPCADVGEIMPNSTCEYRMRNAGKHEAFWSGGQMDYYAGMPTALRVAIDRYDAGVKNAFDSGRANAAIRDGNHKEAAKIVAGNPNLVLLPIPDLSLPAGATYQQAVEIYLKGYGIWDLIDHSTFHWKGNGYTFRFLNPSVATDVLATNPHFTSGVLGFAHLEDVGRLSSDNRSWTSAWAPYSLQVTIGSQGAWADLDRFNPYSGVGFVRHGVLEVLPGKRGSPRWP